MEEIINVIKSNKAVTEDGSTINTWEVGVGATEEYETVKFEPRYTPPVAGNKYYTRYSEGGWSGAIHGKPRDEDLTILANCSGYSQGRICEASKRGKIDLLEPCNPQDFDKYLYGKCTIGMEPKPGAIIVWVKSDNPKAGHVANVEAVLDKDTIVTSESFYGGKAWDLLVHRKVDDEPFYKEGYIFKEFIYSPYIEVEE